MNILNNTQYNQNKGFTLLEILLVIAAIGILASIVLVAINPNRQIAQARNTVRQADINTIQKAVEQYLIETGSYPSSISTTPGYICNTGTEQVGGSTNCSGRVDLRELVPTYLAGIPKDPQDTGTNTGYIVAINPDNNKISIQASLSERGILVINPLSIVTDGLVLNLDAGNLASYPGTGNTWFDLSGNNNNGTLVNGVGFNAANGGALSFDGVNDYVNLNFSFTQSSSTNSYTIVMGAKLSTSSSSRRQLWSSDNGGFDWGFGVGDGSRFIIFSGDSAHTGRLQDTSWHIFTAQWSSLFGTRLYIDNILDISTSTISYDSSISPTTSIGRNPVFGEYWNGNVSFVALYNRVLTPEEIAQNFNATRGRFGL
jgi:prepilin-type N-terminal cleavage/methylation domain-containing protein